MATERPVLSQSLTSKMRHALVFAMIQPCQWIWECVRSAAALPAQRSDFLSAEAAGFEPTMPFQACPISSQVQSDHFAMLARHSIRPGLRRSIERPFELNFRNSPALKTVAVHRRCRAEATG